jgi:hypothetical protein
MSSLVRVTLPLPPTSTANDVEAGHGDLRLWACDLIDRGGYRRGAEVVPVR